ncbi:hypothetical protein KIN20_030452 [Parelaphostrongylus tenuis]|uniref:Uncharacterized protein n=1 Tax=Parelaphostrongylus tenuis TaxID=148309 RepID=A0AAD5WGW2_PARTN|nr:hypothetical protein KIN20_030452 [Parelaphostrongylus tenuis]
MIYSTAVDVRARIPGIASNEAGAKGFVSRLVMQTVSVKAFISCFFMRHERRDIFDVLERQARGALLSDAVISTILGQLTVEIQYEPMLCQIVFDDPTAMNEIKDMKLQNCIIVSRTVTEFALK